MAVTDSFTGTWPGANWSDAVGSFGGHTRDAGADTLSPTNNSEDTLARRTDTFNDIQSSAVVAQMTIGGTDQTGYASPCVLTDASGNAWIMACSDTEAPADNWKVWLYWYDGTWNEVASNTSTGIAVALGDELKVEHDGTNIVCKINDTQVISVVRSDTAGSNSSGTPGFNMWKAANREAIISSWTGTGEAASATGRINVVDVDLVSTEITGRVTSVDVDLVHGDITGRITAVDTDIGHRIHHAFPWSTSGRWAEDTSGNRIYFQGTTPWHIFHRLSTTDRDTVLTDRENRSVNAILASAMVVGSVNYQTTSYNNVNGDPAFTDNDDWTTEVANYWTHVKSGIDECESRGITVFLCPAYLGRNGTTEGWYPHMLNQTVQQMTDWGEWIANYFIDNDNIVWVHGGDEDADIITNLAVRVDAIEQGIRNVAPWALHCYHSKRFSTGRGDYPTGITHDLDTAYGDEDDTANYNKTAYDDTPIIPAVNIEGRYEEHASSSDLIIRSQLWWNFLGGMAGGFYGHEGVWDFPAGWAAKLDDVGTDALEQQSPLIQTNLVPDYTHAILTAGYGLLTDGTYVSCAKSEDNTVVFAYTPDQHALTFNLTSMAQSTGVIDWINPQTGAITSEGTQTLGSSDVYTPPSSGDWIFRATSVSAAARIGTIDVDLVHTDITSRIGTVDADLVLTEITSRVGTVDVDLVSTELDVRIGTVDADLVSTEITGQIVNVDVDEVYAEVSTPAMNADLLTGRIRMVDIRSSGVCGQDDAAGAYNPASITTTSDMKDKLANAGYGFATYTRAFTTTGQVAIGELVTRNADYQFACYYHFGHVRVTDPGLARELESDTRSLLWNKRALDTSAQPIVAWRDGQGEIAYYWANYNTPTGGEIYDKLLIDEQIELLVFEIDAAAYKPVALMVDYVSEKSSGYYVYDDPPQDTIKVDLDQNTTEYKLDSAERDAWDAAQKYFIQRLKDRLGPNIAVIANGRGSWPTEEPTLQSLLQGWYMENFATPPWYTESDACALIWDAYNNQSEYDDYLSRTMPFVMTDLFKEQTMSGDFANAGRCIALLFDGWWNYRPEDTNGLVEADMDDAIWDQWTSDLGQPLSAPVVVGTPGVGTHSYERTFDGGLVRLTINATLIKGVQIVTADAIINTIGRVTAADVDLSFDAITARFGVVEADEVYSEITAQIGTVEADLACVEVGQESSGGGSMWLS